MSEEQGDDPADELRAMVYSGEELGTVEPLADAVVGVTSHRVLVLEPEGAPRFREVALPNVTDAGMETEGNTEAAMLALRRGVYAVALFGASLFTDFGGLLGSVETPSNTGAGQAISVATRIVGLLRAVDDVLGILGLGVAFVALFHAIRYARSREDHFAIAVSGGDRIALDVDRTVREGADRIERAIEQARSRL